jgi:hypothetical protein
LPKGRNSSEYWPVTNGYIFPILSNEVFLKQNCRQEPPFPQPLAGSKDFMFLADDRVFRTTSGRLHGGRFLTERHGPGLTRAENGAVDDGTVHAYCAGQPGSLQLYPAMVVAADRLTVTPGEGVAAKPGQRLRHSPGKTQRKTMRRTNELNRSSNCGVRYGSCLLPWTDGLHALCQLGACKEMLTMCMARFMFEEEGWADKSCNIGRLPGTLLCPVRGEHEQMRAV